MRSTLLAVALATSLAAVDAAQLFRDPLIPTRPVTVIVPPRGMSLQLSRGIITFEPLRPAATLSIMARSLTLRPIPISGITLRVALGPMPDGMLTFRMRPVRGTADRPAPGFALPQARLLTGEPEVGITFAIALEDLAPPATALRRTTHVVVTVERIEGDEGQLIFENPDASELLWEALGKPSFSQ